MGNKWKEVWNGKGIDFEVQGLMETEDEFAVYSALKKLDGFDVNIGDAEAYYRGFYRQAMGTWKEMINDMEISSAYEVGCGSGANLYLLKNTGVGIKLGGIDYSENLVKVAKKALGEECLVEVGEAVDLSEDDRYDLVFSDSVFAYFPNEKYGEAVLEKMYKKARRTVVILEVFDKALQPECERHRRELFPDYDKRYDGLDKVFYSREMFRSFAQKHHCAVEFSDVENEYYWNSRYLFNCFMYKA